MYFDPEGCAPGSPPCSAPSAVFVVPAAAQAACPSTPTMKAFQAFGDTTDYSLVPNGGFEAGASGWSLSALAVTSGNEPWKVHGAGDSKSLAIDAAGAPSRRRSASTSSTRPSASSRGAPAAAGAC